ncbi:MAG: hypothetical protein HY217_13665 [Candidatus Rokubacteria bacterium]|nr:hypothetical protein [Candidatus Rokubacteria bacterium]
MLSAFPILPPITSEAVWTTPGQEDGAGTNADFGPVESRATEGAGHRAVAEDAVDGAVGPAVIVDAPVGHVVAMLEELPESEPMTRFARRSFQRRIGARLYCAASRRKRLMYASA